jgi:S1-C subfamily serine protease
MHIEGEEQIREQARSQARTSVDPIHPFAAGLSKSAWSIFAMVGDEWRPSGTGFIVSREGLMMTARHVVTSATRDTRRSRDGDHWRYGNVLFLAAYGGSPEDPVMDPPRLFSISEVSSAVNDDVAVCRLSPIGSANSFDFAPLKLRPVFPNVGEEVLAFGYDQLDPTPPSDLVDNHRLDIRANGHLSIGYVEAVHWPRKKSGLANFPCFDFSASIHGGMSGGPVLDTRGNVCGVISHSRSWERSATAAGLALVMGAKISLSKNLDGSERDVKIYELMRSGIIAHDGSFDRIRFEDLPDGEFGVSIAE